MGSNIQKIIDRGVDFLAKGQKKDGSFLCLVSKKLDDYRKAETVPAIVPTNIVLSSLACIEGAKTARIKEKAATFLLGERGEYWSFNYWFKKSDWYKKEPYPDDTDDTFCALAALYEYDSRLFDGEVMAKIVTMITSCEEKEGGPYDMWLVPPSGRKKWRDIDLVCNANIAYFLSLQDISLPKVNAFVEKSIDERDYEFPYNKIYPGAYFVSRFYKGKKVGKIVKLLLSKQERDGKWENPLRTALAISSLINLEGVKHFRQLEKGIEYLIKMQKKDGSWEPYSFYYQCKLPERTLFAGSPFITTALCLEAINKFQKSEVRSSKFETDSTRSPQANSKSEVLNSKREKEIYNAVLKRYKQRFSGFSNDFRENAVKFADKILRKHRDIVLLPFYFQRALGANGRKVSDDFIVQLGVATVFGWVAYTIYDDFLDEEGDPQELPLAHVCLRESAEIFNSFLRDYSKKIFDIIDDANMWEVNNCRDVSKVPSYGDYSQLANKSLGHALGPIAILFALGYKAHSAEVKNTMRFFKNYIIARQLNDDAHDWEDDLKKGQVNAVGARLLKDAKGESALGGKNLKKLREIFWHKTVVGACEDILKHVELARKDLKKLSLITEPEVFLGMLAAIERSVEEALKERAETMKFIKTYSLATQNL